MLFFFFLNEIRKERLPLRMTKKKKKKKFPFRAGSGRKEVVRGSKVLLLLQQLMRLAKLLSTQSDTPMSMSMSLTSGVHENSKCDPDDSEAESSESKSSAAVSESMSNLRSDGSGNRSVSESRSARADSALDPPDAAAGSCLMTAATGAWW